MCSSDLANLLAAELLARRIGRGAEVVIPAVTWPTHAWAALQAGLRVRFCDVHPDRFVATPATVDAAATPETRAVWLVHPLGIVADVLSLREVAAHRGWTLAEDCCDALGARDVAGGRVGAGTLAGTFSFFLSHALTTLEGGMVVVDRGHAPALRAWRSHGWARDLRDGPAKRVLTGGNEGPFVFADTGWNLRPTEVQAAIGRAQLARWPATAGWREERAVWWRHVVGTVAMAVPEIGLRLPPAPMTGRDAFHGLPFHAPGYAEPLCRALNRAGVETRPVLAGDMTAQPAVRALVAAGRVSWRGSDEGRPLPAARAVHLTARYLGLLPHATEAMRDRLADAFLTACRAARDRPAFSKEAGDA